MSLADSQSDHGFGTLLVNCNAGGAENTVRREISGNHRQKPLRFSAPSPILR